MEKHLEKRKGSDLYLFSYQTGEPSPKPVVFFRIDFLSFVGGLIHFWQMGNISTFPYYEFVQFFSLYFFELKTCTSD
jgi:hypothetical protein